MPWDFTTNNGDCSLMIMVFFCWKNADDWDPIWLLNKAMEDMEAYGSHRRK